MANVIDEVKDDLEREFVSMGESFGFNPSIMKIYVELFFSQEPLGLAEISEKTGYSKSTVCNSMVLLERLTDIRRFQKPGSKKVYFECLHDLKTIQNKKIEEFTKTVKSMSKTLEDADSKLSQDGSEQAQKIREYLSEWRKGYGKLNKVIGFIEKIMELKK